MATKVLKKEIKSATLFTIAETKHVKEVKLLQQKGVTIDSMKVF